MKKPQTALSRFYPRWIVDRDGLRRLIQNPDHHGQMMFTEYNDDATPKYSPPPTLHEVLDRGYSPDAAIDIVKEEERKARAHEWPYYEGAPATPPVPETPFDDPPQAVPVPAGTFADAETVARLDAGPPIEAAPVEPAAHVENPDPPPSEPFPVSEPFPELPHETVLEPVAEIPGVEPPVDEIEEMFQKPKKGRKAKD